MVRFIGWLAPILKIPVPISSSWGALRLETRFWGPYKSVQVRTSPYESVRTKLIKKQANHIFFVKTNENDRAQADNTLLAGGACSSVMASVAVPPP